jgi:hypothetical protein
MSIKYAKVLIVRSMTTGDIYYSDGTLQEFTGAAESLNYAYDYQETEDGYDFMAWDLNDEEKVARIKL